MPTDEMVAEINEAIDQSIEQDASIGGDPTEQATAAAAAEDDENSGDFGNEVSVAEETYESQRKRLEGQSGDGHAPGQLDEADGVGEAGQAESKAGDAEAEGTKPQEVVEPAGVSQAGVIHAIKNGMSATDARSFGNDSDLMQAIQAHGDAARSRIDETRTDELEDGTGLDKSPLRELLDSVDKDDYDPAVLAALEAIAKDNEARDDRLAELQQTQVDTASASQQRQADEAEHWFDGQVEALGEEFSGSLGKGASSGMVPTSDEYAARAKIAEQISVLDAGYNAQNITSPPRNDLFDQAARLVLGKEYQAIHEKAVASGLKKREGQIISRPGGGNSSSKQTPEMETAALIDQKFGLR